MCISIQSRKASFVYAVVCTVYIVYLAACALACRKRTQTPLQESHRAVAAAPSPDFESSIPHSTAEYPVQKPHRSKWTVHAWDPPSPPPSSAQPCMGSYILELYYKTTRPLSRVFLQSLRFPLPAKTCDLLLCFAKDRTRKHPSRSSLHAYGRFCSLVAFLM